jgi:hypothetical protein
MIKTPLTPKQAEYLLALAKERKPLDDLVINDRDDLNGISKADASHYISRYCKQPLLDDKAAEQREVREVISSVPAGKYTFTPTQAAKVKNHKSEPYFGKVAVTVMVNRAESGAFWIDRVGDTSHPIRDKRAKRDIMLACASKVK